MMTFRELSVAYPENRGLLTASEVSCAVTHWLVAESGGEDMTRDAVGREA